jgi:hypothetical protein
VTYRRRCVHPYSCLVSAVQDGGYCTQRSDWYAAIPMMSFAQVGEVASGRMWTTIRGCDACCELRIVG